MRNEESLLHHYTLYLLDRQHSSSRFNLHFHLYSFATVAQRCCFRLLAFYFITLGTVRRTLHVTCQTKSETFIQFIFSSNAPNCCSRVASNHLKTETVIAQRFSAWSWEQCGWPPSPRDSFLRPTVHCEVREAWNVTELTVGGKRTDKGSCQRIDPSRATHMWL